MITTILNVYRRPYYLQEQINAILAQTIKSEIWIWVNYHEDNKDFDFSKLTGVARIVKSDHNFKYHGRFTLGLLADTKVVAVFDDDTIPGVNWYKNCIESYNKQPGIYVGAGVILHSKSYAQHTRVGWPSMNSDITRVDLGGHAWFLPKQALQCMFIETPYLNNGEDIQLSFNALKYANIQTFCPPHPTNDRTLWSSLSAVEKGNDNKASSNGSLMPVNDFYKQRDDCVGYALKNGWKTVKNI